MTTMRKTYARLVQWFKSFREKNRSPHRWYDHDLPMH